MGYVDLMELRITKFYNVTKNVLKFDPNITTNHKTMISCRNLIKPYYFDKL